jgi:hypothetical protein
MAHPNYFDDAVPSELADAAMAFSVAVVDEQEGTERLRALVKEHEQALDSSPVNITEWPFIVDAAHQLVEARWERELAEKTFTARLNSMDA